MGFTISGVYALKFLKDVTGTATAISVPWFQSIDFESETEDLTWEGDGITRTVTYNTGLSAEITADAFSPEVLASLFGTTATTTSLPTGVAKRYLFGTTAMSGGVTVGMLAAFYMVDEDTGASKYGRIYVPKAILSPPGPPAGLATKATAQMVCNISAIKTTTDVSGDAIVGVSGDGGTWLFEELSSSTALF